jgi:hypothetical protein
MKISGQEIRLFHAPGNPRNSEGAFATLRDGRLLFVWSRFSGDSSSDHAPAALAARLSSDGGRTWPRETERILVDNAGGCNVMSVSLLRLTDDRLALFYLRKDSLEQCLPIVRYSTNDGQTWIDPIGIASWRGYYVVNNDRVIQLRSGRILIPAAWHRTLHRVETPSPSGIDGRGHFVVFYSDDGGMTWGEGPEQWTLPLGSHALQEPGLIERHDGSVVAWFRTTTGRQWWSQSYTRGETWSPPQPWRFRSPCSPLSLKRIPRTGHWLAVWNDAAEAVRRWGADKRLIRGRVADRSWGRTPLVAAISRNEGQTWSRPRILEATPDHGYCYTAIHFTDEAVLLAYCCGGGRTSHVLQDLKIRRIPLSWFYESAEGETA